MRETCICETPTRSAISLWVRSSTKRRCRTSRSRSEISVEDRLRSRRRTRPCRTPRSSLPIRSRSGAGSSPSPIAGEASSETAWWPWDACIASSTCSVRDARAARRCRRTVGARPSRAGQLRQGPLDLEDPLLDVAGHVHRPAPVAEVALELAEDRGDGEGREGGAALGVEAVDRLDQADARDLDQVVERLGAARVPGREPPRERHEALDQLLADGRRGILGVAAQQRPLVRELLVGTG